uniref:RT_RNaseH_2 domain-containing protein n=1 Tax=Loa loa TaxID=7209 RepID=A0A1I7W4P4_LOALO
MVRLKLFIQHLWRQNVTWDQSLSESDSQYWRNLINEWPTNVIELPRHVINPLQSPEFHVFTDASQVAYSAAVYIRNCMPEGWSTSSLIFAKSRIAPIKVDIATRGLSPCKLRNNEQWWNGPDWLDQDESQWPNDHFRYQGQDEFEKAIIANVTTSPVQGG